MTRSCSGQRALQSSIVGQSIPLSPMVLCDSVDTRYLVAGVIRFAFRPILYALAGTRSRCVAVRLRRQGLGVFLLPVLLLGRTKPRRLCAPPTGGF